MKAILFRILNALPVPVSFGNLAPAYPAPEINLCGGEK